MWCTIVGCRFFYVGIPNRTGVLTVGNSNRTVARRRRNRVITIRGLFFCGDGHPSTLSYYFYHHHTETFLYPIIIICLQPVAAHNFSWFLVPRTTFCTFHFRRWSHPLPTWPFSCPTQLYGGTTILNLQTLWSCFWETHGKSWRASCLHNCTEELLFNLQTRVFERHGKSWRAQNWRIVPMFQGEVGYLIG